MSAYIKHRLVATKHPRTGRRDRYYVYYRRSSGHTEQYAGSFPTKQEAQARRDLIAYELANLRDPALLIDEQRQPTRPRSKLGIVYPTWALSRRDVGESAKALYGNSGEWWLRLLGPDTDPARVTVDMILAGVDVMLDELSPATVRLYKSHLGMVLDFADVTPNPARSPKIKLPKTAGERDIPSNDEWAAILARITDRSRLAVRLMECCGFRVSEACGIVAGDIDQAGGMILVRRSKTAAGRNRWVPCPPELLEPLLERGGVGVNATQVYYDLRAACRAGKVREFGTHVLRHRRISLWIRQGVDDVQLSRWAGHAKASLSKDTYGHVIVDALADEWLSFWGRVYSRQSAAPVRTGETA